MSLGMRAQLGCLVLVHLTRIGYSGKGAPPCFMRNKERYVQEKLLALLRLTLLLQMEFGTRMEQLSLNCLANLDANCKCKSKK